VGIGTEIKQFKAMKTILHLCADIGSDSYFYQQDSNYKVILIGESIGVENFSTTEEIYGIIANPVCTEFSTANGFHKQNDLEKGMFLVNHCLRIIEETKPHFWVLENPYNGKLKDIIGKPKAVYQPWEFGDPWTKKTALWGDFNMPFVLYNNWQVVPKNDKIYTRPNRAKPSLAFLHKSAIQHIENLKKFENKIKNDADFRSLCSQGFAKEFYKFNQ
jgi:hypothetical protein